MNKYLNSERHVQLQIDQVDTNELILVSPIYGSNAPGSRDTLARHPVHPSMLKLMKPCMIEMFWQPQRILSILWVHNWYKQIDSIIVKFIAT